MRLGRCTRHFASTLDDVIVNDFVDASGLCSPVSACKNPYKQELIKQSVQFIK